MKIFQIAMGRFEIYIVFFAFCFSFLPEFSSPMLLATIFFTIASNNMIGLTACIYFDAILCLVIHADFYELCAYILLTLFGSVLTSYLQKKQYRKFVYLIIIALSISIPSIFQFLAAFTFDKQLAGYGFITGIVTSFLVFLFFDKISIYTTNQKKRSLEEILDIDYPLALEYKEYSNKEYTHARKVSDLCGMCADIIGIDEKIAKAAGFYYKIGKLVKKKDFVKDSINIAQKHLFPTEVTMVLAEYNGELCFPTTKISAMVHLVDALVTKFEIIGKDTLESSWNHDVVIYQVFNEISASGIYDESGLTMNQFLKIREFFVKGNDLL